MLRFEFAACDFLISLSTVVFVVVVVSVILGAGDKAREREKSLFNSVRSEQLLPRLGELLFISFGFPPD
jgi:hypothetical protein